jgi:hypothetical protein
MDPRRYEKTVFLIRFALFKNKQSVENLFSSGWSKMPGCKAPESLRSEAYLNVRCNDEG